MNTGEPLFDSDPNTDRVAHRIRLFERSSDPW